MRKYRKQWIERWAEDVLRLERPIVQAMADIERHIAPMSSGDQDRRETLCECIALARELNRGGVSIFTFDPDAYDEIERSDAFGTEEEAIGLFPYSTSFIETRRSDAIAGLGVISTDLVEEVAHGYGWSDGGVDPAEASKIVVPIPHALPTQSDHPKTLLDAIAFNVGKYIRSMGMEINEGSHEWAMERLSTTGANLVAFLSAPNMRGQIDLTYDPTKDEKGVARQGKVSRRASAQAHYEVGARFGSAIRLARREDVNAHAREGRHGSSPAPHPVRGHWSKRRHGPRDNWHYEPCYIHPYLTGKDSGEPMSNVVRQVLP